MTALLPFYICEDDPPAKREIVRAAMKLFSQQGLSATSIRDIADESGYTNPALYKHFVSKEQLALHLFEKCHGYVWTNCACALASADQFGEKLEAYIGQWLELVDQHPEVFAFLSDSGRVLGPKLAPTVRRKTMVRLVRSLFVYAPQSRSGASAVTSDLAAASLHGCLAELARMIQDGMVEGPATRWKTSLVTLFLRLTP